MTTVLSPKPQTFGSKCNEILKAVDNLQSHLGRISDADTLPFSGQECDELLQMLHLAQFHAAAAALIVNKEVCKWGL